MNKRLILIIGVVILVAVMAALYFLFRTSNDKQNPQSGYPESVQQIIENPIEKLADNFGNIIKNDNYLISYGGDQNDGTFFITVNAEPVVEVAQQAEQDLLNKLQIDEDYACSLTVVLSVPHAIDSNLSEYDFGMSFCPDRIHISDVPRLPTENTRYYDDFSEPAPSQTNSIR